MMNLQIWSIAGQTEALCDRCFGLMRDEAGWERMSHGGVDLGCTAQTVCSHISTRANHTDSENPVILTSARQKRPNKM